jgi:hypothetical protein
MSIINRNVVTKQVTTYTITLEDKESLIWLCRNLIRSEDRPPEELHRLFSEIAQMET